MKARKDLRRYVNRARRRYGKKNGVLPVFCFDFGPRPAPWTDKRDKPPRYRNTWQSE